MIFQQELYAGNSARCVLDLRRYWRCHSRIFDLEFSSDGLKLFTVYGSASYNISWCRFGWYI